ncbi:MAG: hypothetical protein ACKVOK_02510, partial [Flavobacteriales bacterium]
MKYLFAFALIAYVNGAFLRAQLTSSTTAELLQPHEYGGAMGELFLYNQGIARSEAMGKTSVAEGNSIVYSLYNPALLSSLKNFEVQAGMMQPNSIYDDGFNMNFSAGMRYGPRLTSSFTFQRLRSEEFRFTDELGNVVSTFRPLDTRVNLSTAYTIVDQPHHKLAAGAGVNYVSSVLYTPIKYAGATVDLGINYRTEIDSIHHFAIGISANNLTNQRIWLIDEATGAERVFTLPQVLRSGISYSYKPTWTATKKQLKIIETTIHGQFDELINSAYFSTWKAGIEIKLLETLCIRGGYYKGNGALLTGHYAFTGTDYYDRYE